MKKTTPFRRTPSPATGTQRRARTLPPETAAAAESRAHASFPIVGIGASAGGLEAFSTLLARLPVDTGMGFVLVQHLDPQHESALTQILDRATAMPVVEVTDKLRVERNHVYVIPPNTTLGIAGGVLTLGPRPNTRAPHRSIDAFFETLAVDLRELAIGVILSGTASDGTLGLEAIKAEGGITFAQDDSARYDSMPRSAIAAGCVDAVLSPEHIADEIARIARHPGVRSAAPDSPTRAEDDRASATANEDDVSPLPSGGPGDSDNGATPSRAEAGRRRGREAPSRGTEDGFKRILLLLRNHAGVDFSFYKSNTIRRRITRRLILTKHDTFESYAQFLRGNTHELDALYSDVLISVTSFFRNPEAFDVLQRKVLPRLLQQGGDDPIRLWVLGCSTGQEAYSFAMAFVEALEQAPRMHRLQVFATDLNEALLDKARHGLYAKSIEQDLSPERLRRFFVAEEGGYRITKALREMVVFARQNVISDPPFSRLDIISCRNLLIYFEADLQKRVFPAFHFALKPGGVLCLGASESIGGFAELFEPIDKTHKIFARKSGPTPAFRLPLTRTQGAAPAEDARGTGRGRPLPGNLADGTYAELTVQREADRVSANNFAPPAVVVSADLQILQFRGLTGAYLQPPTGKASLDVLKMARNGLMLPLRSAITQAKKENKTVRRDNVRVERDGTIRAVSLQVIPLKHLKERAFLIVFQDTEQGRTGAPSAPAGRAKRGGGPSTNARPARAERDEQARRIAELETDLAETRDYLQVLQEQHEAAHEELQASNEEVQSANEELQSINEELETSKEELEAGNEELTTVNDEMAHRNAELQRLNSDLVNVQTSAHVAMVLLARNLAIRRFSAQAEQQFNLLSSDLGRPIGHVRLPFDLPDLEPLITDVITTVHAQEREVQDKNGRWYALRVRPYLTIDNRVDGAVLVLMDIDALKRAEQSLTAARNYADNIVATVREPILVLDTGLRVERASRAFYQTFDVEPGDTLGKFVYDLGNRQWDIPELRRLLGTILQEDRTIESFAVEHTFERLGRRIMLLNARRMHDPEQRAELILLAFEDITERRQTDALLRESETRYRSLIQALTSVIWTTSADGRFVTEQLSWSQFTGQPWDEYRDWGWTNALHPDDRDRIQGLWTAALVAGAVYDAAGRVWHAATGTYRHFEARAVPVLNATGSIREWVGQISDVDDRTRAEEARARLVGIVESSDDAIVSKDLDGIITSWNAGAERLFGYTAEEAVGRPVTMLIPPDRLDEETAILGRIRRSQVVEPFDTVRRRKDGTTFDASITVSPIRDHHGRVVGASKIARDITERRQTELALREADHHKNQFLAMLAHELRNPLAPILVSIEILRRARQIEGSHSDIVDLSHRVDHALEVLQRQVGQMVRLIEDLLDAGRIKSGKIALRRTSVELSSVVQQAVDAARPLAERMEQTLTVTLPPLPLWVDADPTRLAQIVGNLLNNACKFTGRGGRIWLTVEDTEDARRTGIERALHPVAGQVVIRVRDSGIGIAPDRLDRIFDMFTQLDTSLERSVSGLGIGLTLVKTLAEMHGGTIEASSPGLGHGSEFVVRLPIVVDAPADDLSQPAPAPAPPPLRILIVDDNRDAAESLALLLRFGGHETHTAHDGVAAVDAANSLEPDVVFLDIGLPGLNGYEVARKIRDQHNGHTGRPLLVALTGWGQDEDRRRSQEAGFNAHIVKPVSDLALGQLLAQLGSSNEPAEP